jgi:uroporphyrinogen decarboxylase
MSIFSAISSIPGSYGRDYTGSMERKERVRRALRREPIDRFPSQTNYTAKLGETYADHAGISFEDLDDYFDNHLLRVDVSYPRRFSSDGKTAYDWWGAGFSTDEEGYLITDPPLSRVDPEAEEAPEADYAWPDPEDPNLLDGARKRMAAEGESRFVIPNFGFALFERAWSLRGFEQFMLDMALYPGFSENLLERITEIQGALASRFVALGVDGGYFGDDLGAQRGMLFSPEVWRRMFKPRMQRLFSVFTDAGLPVILHSDGDIREILPDLIEIGLTALNPCQPEVLDHRWLKREYGRDLAFYGGISTQEVFPHGDPGKVREAGRACLTTLGSDGTGLIYGPSHRLMADVPLANLDAYRETLKDLTADTLPEKGDTE